MINRKFWSTTSRFCYYSVRLKHPRVDKIDLKAKCKQNDQAEISYLPRVCVLRERKNFEVSRPAATADSGLGIKLQTVFRKGVSENET